MTLHIEIPEDAQARLAAEAEARGLPLEAYAGDLLQQSIAQILPRKPRLTVENFHEMLRQMAEGSEHLPELPTDSFSRESFYEDRG
jgi:hypothetical protein